MGLPSSESWTGLEDPLARWSIHMAGGQRSPFSWLPPEQVGHKTKMEEATWISLAPRGRG